MLEQMQNLNFSFFDDGGSQFPLSNYQFETEKENLKGFLMIMQNIRGVNKNLNSLIADLQSKNMKYDILALTETWHRYGDTGFIDNYDTFERSSGRNKSSGVAIIVKKLWKADLFHPDYIQSIDIMDIVAIRISNFSGIKNDHIICSCYRSPSSQPDKFLEVFEETLQKFNLDKLTVTLLGDFNINILDISSEVSCMFKSIIYNTGFRIICNSSTRAQGNSNTALDLMITNIALDTYTCVVDSHITDHMTIMGSIDISNSLESIGKKSNKITVLDECSAIQELSNMNFEDIFQIADLDNAVQELVDRIQVIIKRHFKVYKNSNKYTISKDPWMTPGILKSIKRKDKLYKKYKAKPHREDLKIKFNEFKKTLNRVINAAKSSNIRSKLNSNIGNSEKKWKIINCLLKGKSSSASEVIKSLRSQEGVDISKDIDMVEYANKYFTSFEESNSISFEDALNHIEVNQHTAFAFPTNVQEISAIIATLKNKKSTGIDDISNRILKKLPNIRSLLAHLVNKTLSDGKFPCCLKMGIIKMEYKSGPKQDIGNYRPLTILTSLSKVFEKALYNRILSFLNKFKIINNLQYGFRKGLSTEDAINKIVSQIGNNMEEGKFTLAISLDISKAFDSVSHLLLLKKFEKYGFRGKFLNIIASYLKDRLVCTEFNNTKSTFKECKFGVPQGSILGPLLFIIFSNDIQNIEEDGNITLYADDNFSLMDGIDFHNLKIKFQIWIINICNWYKINGMKLNKGKSKFIIFAKTGQLKRLEESDKIFKVGSTKLKAVNDLIYLGIHFESSLNWNVHIKNLYSKMLQFLPTLYRLRCLVDKDTLVTLVKVILITKVEYGLGVYGNTYIGFLKGLNIVIKKAVRIINFSGKRESVKDVMYMDKIPNIFQLYICHILSTLCKIKCGGKNDINLQLVKPKRSASYNFRDQNLYIVERLIPTSIIKKHSLNFRIITLVNHLFRLGQHILEPSTLDLVLQKKDIRAFVWSLNIDMIYIEFNNL